VTQSYTSTLTRYALVVTAVTALSSYLSDVHVKGVGTSCEPPSTHSAPCALYTRPTRSQARSTMPVHSTRSHLNSGSHADELRQLQGAGSMLPYRCAQRARASSQILQQSSRSSTLVHTKLTEGRHHAGVQLRAAAASGQAPLLPPAASSCSAPPAWQPLHCEEPRSQLRRHGGAGGHCDGRRGRPRPDLKNPSTTVGAPSPCAASTDHGEGRCGLSYYVKVFHQLLPHVTRLYPVHNTAERERVERRYFSRSHCLQTWLRAS
jgi:hypothetical protein